MDSLWQMTGPRIGSDDFDGSHHDVVVGAGLTGLTTALLLARAGQRVIVLEARHAGAATTGNTTGKLSLLQGTVFSDIRNHAGHEALAAYAEANREGQAWLMRQMESWGAPVSRRVAYTYAAEPSQVDALEEERDAARSVGVDVAECDDPLLPFEVPGALMLPDQAQLQPIDVLAELAGELRERGGRIVEECRVRDVEQRGAVEVISDRGSATAAVCVLATGTPILDRGMFFAKLIPSRSFALAFQLSDGAAPSGMYVSVGQPSLSLRTAAGPSNEEVLVTGGGDHVTGQSANTRAEIEKLDEWTRSHFDVGERITWWAAQDYRSHSRLPSAGELPRGRGRIYTATGFNKWGMTNGVAAALAITAEILGGNLEWANSLRDHASRFTAVRDAVKANASVAARAVGGWGSAVMNASDNTVELREGDGAVLRDGLAPVGMACVDGKIDRVSAVCPHLGGIVNWNRAERSWDCPLHGSRFAADGTRLEGPAVEDLAEPPSRDGSTDRGTE